MKVWKRRAALGVVLLSAAMRPAVHGEMPAVRAERPADPAGATKLAVKYASIPLSFEVNRGQTDEAVKFLARGNGYAVFLTAQEAVLALRSEGAARRGDADQRPHAPQTVRMKLVGGNAAADIRGTDPLPGRISYFKGNDPTRWRANIPTYGQVWYESVYPGVDLVFYGNQRRLEYDFILAPGADPAVIQFAIEASSGSQPHQRPASSLRLDASGDLIIPLGGDEVRLHRPQLYQPATRQGRQTREPVDGRFVLLRADRVGFEVGPYDRTRPLVIDPVLAYSSYLGGELSDGAAAVAADSAGNAYVTGRTESPDFPILNPWTDSGIQSSDAFVTKISPAGTLLFSTFVGGSEWERGHGIAVSPAGYVYVVGITASRDLPAPFGFQPAHGGQEADAFLIGLSDDGLSLVYGTYLGGTSGDLATGVAVDASGYVYVVGSTSSALFPTTTGAFMESGDGINDAFVAKLDTGLSGAASLVYSTLLGGGDNDGAHGVAVDSSGNVYVAGFTMSDNFPTENPLYATRGGLPDAFVAKLSSDGAELFFASYLGANNASISSIAVDGLRNIYVTGHALSGVPLENALYSFFKDFYQTAFVSKIKADGSAFVYSTLLPGTSQTEGRGIAVDSQGSAYVTGITAGATNGLSDTFPVVRAVQSRTGGEIDAFVSKLAPDGSALIYSTYLGGSRGDSGSGIAVDGLGNAHVVGTTFSNTDFPLVNAFQDVFAGGFTDGFVARISLVPDFALAAVSPLTVDVGGSASTPVTVESLDAFDATVTLSAATPPDGFSVSFAPTGVAPSADGSASATMTVDLQLAVTPGIYTFDVTGTSGELSHSRGVALTVRPSASGTSDVIDGLTAIGCIDNSGIAEALISKLAQAQAFIDAGKTQAAVNTLQALLNQLHAQAGKHIATSCTEEGATFNPVEVLIAQVEALLQTMGAATANPIMGYVLNAKGGAMAGITVTLFPPSGPPVAAVSTDVTGFYFLPETGRLAPRTTYTTRLSTIPKPYKNVSPAFQQLTWTASETMLQSFVLK